MSFWPILCQTAWFRQLEIIFYRSVSPVEGHQWKIQYLEQYKNANEKGLWTEKDNEVSQWNGNVWRDMRSWLDQQCLIVTDDFGAG